MLKDIEAQYPQLIKLFQHDYKNHFPCDDTFSCLGTYTFEPGNKYIRIVNNTNQRSCAGFICIADTVVKGKQFYKGDLLKSAGWKGPALNFARGNIFTLDDWTTQKACRWTGIA